MYIMSQDRRSIVNADSLWVEGTGVMCLFADCPPECIGSFETENEAIFVITEIFKHIQDNPAKPYKMPPNAIGKTFLNVNDPDWYDSMISKEVELL